MYWRTGRCWTQRRRILADVWTMFGKGGHGQRSDRVHFRVEWWEQLPALIGHTTDGLLLEACYE